MQRQIDGSVQYLSNSSTLAMELLQFNSIDMFYLIRQKWEVEVCVMI